MSETIKNEITQEKPYTFRRLTSDDMFPMFNIISKIGIREFSKCFGGDDFKNVMKSFTGKDESVKTVAGISVALEMVNIICGNLPRCKEDIYQLLSQVSGLETDTIKNFDMVTFTEMIIDFVKKEEFGDFIKVVSKLFK